jgi:hypothetical protein
MINRQPVMQEAGHMDVNPIQLMSFAKEASERYVQHGVSLNEAIAKIAEQHELNPMQIRRVVEIANHDVQGSLYKGAEDKSFTFELADATRVIQTVQGTNTKVASFDVIEAALTPPRCRESIVKMASEIVASDPDLGLKKFAEVHDNLETIGESIQVFRRDLIIKKASVDAEIDGVLTKIAGMAKDHIILNNGRLSDFLKYACHYDSDMAKAWKGIFEYIRADMMKLGAPVDKSLISDNLEIPNGNLEIINGSHQLAIYLDTIKNKISEEDRMAKRIRLMDTFGDAVVDRMKVLRTPEDIDKQVVEDTWMLSKAAALGFEPFVEEVERRAGMVLPAAAITAGLGLGYGGYKMLQGTAKGVRKKMDFQYNPHQEMRRLRQLS